MGEVDTFGTSWSLALEERRGANRMLTERRSAHLGVRGIARL